MWAFWNWLKPDGTKTSLCQSVFESIGLLASPKPNLTLPKVNPNIRELFCAFSNSILMGADRHKWTTLLCDELPYGWS